jgi:hypothetical protein
MCVDGINGWQVVDEAESFFPSVKLEWWSANFNPNLKFKEWIALAARAK